MVGEERGEIMQQRKEEERQTKGTTPKNRRGGESKAGKGERAECRGQRGDKGAGGGIGKGRQQRKKLEEGDAWEGVNRSHDLDRRDREGRGQGGRRGGQGSPVLNEHDDGIKGITLGRSGRGRCRVSLFREVERGRRDQGGSGRGDQSFRVVLSLGRVGTLGAWRRRGRSTGQRQQKNWSRRWRMNGGGEGRGRR